MEYDDDIQAQQKKYLNKHDFCILDCFRPATQQRQDDYELTHVYKRSDLNMVNKTRAGFEYIVGDPKDRAFAGQPFTGNAASDAHAHRIVPSYDDGGAGFEEEPVNWVPDTSRPVWHTEEFRHQRPWHVRGEQITWHFNHKKELLATGAAYATEGDVLDALRNDEFVPFP